MALRRMLSLFISTALWVILLPSAAQAYRLVDNQELTLDIIGWARTGYQITVRDVTDSVRGETFLSFARIGARADYAGWGSAFVNLEGFSGDMLLLDVEATLSTLPHFDLHVGRFRSPHSADLISMLGPVIPFVRRSEVVSRGFAFGRLDGVEGILHHDWDSFRGAFHLGVFNPPVALNDPGQILMLRGWAYLPGGLQVHAAYADHLRGSNPIMGPGLGRALRYDRQVDIALYYCEEGITAYVEGLVVFDSVEPERPFALYAMLLKDVVLSNGHIVQPGARYDLTRESDVLRHQGTVGLTYALKGHLLKATVNYVLDVEGSDVDHDVLIQLQAGF